MSESRTKKSIRNVIFAGLFSIVDNIFPFILRTALLKILGDQYLGINNLFHSVLLVLTLAELGFGQAFSFCLLKPIAEDDTEKTCALLNLYRKICIIIGIITLTAGLAVIPYLDKIVKNGYPPDVNIVAVYLIYLSETVIFYFLFADKFALLGALQMTFLYDRAVIIIQIIISVLRIICLALFRNYYIFIIFIPLLALLKKLTAYLIVNRKYSKYVCKGETDWEDKQKVIKLSCDVAINKFGAIVSGSLGSIVISSLMGLTPVAIYGNYTYVYSALLGIANACISSLTPSIGNSIVKESVEKNYSLFNQINLINQMFTCVFSNCLFCLYFDFMKFWVGIDLCGDLSYSLVFTLLFYYSLSRKSIEVFKNACGIWREDRLKPMVSGIANIVITFLLFNRLKVLTPAIATILCYLLIEIPWETKTLFNGYFNMSVKRYYEKSITFLLMTIITTSINYCLCLPINGNFFFIFIVKGVICFISSALLFVLFVHKKEDFSLAVEKIMQIIPEKYKKNWKVYNED